MEKVLTTADVVELLEPIGITAKQFRGWCEGGWVVPTEGGDGHGDHRKFSLMQAVGVIVAAKVFKSEQGCALTYVKKVVNAFRAADERKLKAQFEKGQTRLMVIHHGKPFLSGETKFGWVDVQRTYQEVIAKVEQIETKLAGVTLGRTRGLAGRSE